jgi:CobQ-like glutamine amidotransferase family enzyme
MSGRHLASERRVVSGRGLSIVELFPGALFPQGDGGNLLALAWRARRRGLDVSVGEVPLGGEIPHADIYAIGGGEDEDAPILATRLARSAALRAALYAGAVLFASGQGYELLGSSFERYDTGERVDGAGLIDVRFDRGAFVDRRVVTRPNAALGLPAISGYESHCGRATLGADVSPLAALEIGTGNGGDPATDGAIGRVRDGWVLGTWLHGPVLPRNPELADLVLAHGLGVGPADLAPLGDRESRFADLVRTERIAEARRYATELTPP